MFFKHKQSQYNRWKKIWDRTRFETQFNVTSITRVIRDFIYMNQLHKTLVIYYPSIGPPDSRMFAPPNMWHVYIIQKMIKKMREEE